ncbi:MAG TPA: ferrochelatase [Candidatus Xenobia bacterium]|nr:ferrochelatase [Candidatus Xenobia bacterium]
MSERGNQAEGWGVLLLAHGAPENPADVPEFLLHVRGGRPLPPAAVEEVKRRYELIGGSPLRKHAERQAEALAERLQIPVFVGMRNWHPFISEAVAEVERRGLRRVVAICLAPHNSRTSVGMYKKHLEEAVTCAGAPLLVQFVESWHDQSFLVEAFAEKLRATRLKAEQAAGRGVPVILTAHSVPERTIAEGDPYDAQVRETAAQVAAAAGCSSWHLAYQSQGMTEEPWLGPTVESVVDRLATEGHQHVLLAPIGFLCDHVEILYDVDIVFRQYAQGKRIALWRTESLNDSPLLIEALAALVWDALRAHAPATS